jgi:hypothetical protein
VKGREVQSTPEAVDEAAPDRLTRWALVVSVAITAIYALTSLALPFGWDHGIIASVGTSYVHGKLPYVDSWDMKGPLSYLPFAVTQALFGPTMWGVRLFDVIVAAIASFVFYNGLRSLTTWRIAACAGFALYYWTAAAGWFYTATPEPWTGFLCVIAIMPCLTSSEAMRNRDLALSGFLVGCVGLSKPIYLIVGLTPLLSIMFLQDLTLRQRAGLALALAVGAAAPIILVYGYFAWRGGLSQAIEVQILYPLSTYAYLDNMPRGKIAVDGFAEFFARPTVALLVPFVALGVWASRKQPQILWPTLGWLAATVFAVAAQGKYYFYHWFPVYAPLLLFAALGAQALARVKGGSPLFLTCSAALAFAVQVCGLPFYDAAKYIYYVALKHEPYRYYASYHTYLYNAEDERAAARYVTASTKPDDSVFVWGNDATVPYLADRPNPSRFTFEMPLSLPGPYLERYRAEAIRELRARPPTYFIVGINWWAPDTKQQSLAKFPEMADFLGKEYSFEKSFGVLDLYRRKAHPE